jgi:hypothetical protein
VALTTQVWAVPRSLATTCGITVVFSSSGYLDVSVLRVCSFVLHLQCSGFPHSEIFGYNGYSAPSRSLSQPITSFIAYKIQGIHHTPLSNFLTKICFTLTSVYRSLFCFLIQYVKERFPLFSGIVENIGVEPMTLPTVNVGMLYP